MGGHIAPTVPTIRAPNFGYAYGVAGPLCLNHAPAALKAEMEPGRPGHGSPGRRVNILGRVGSGHGSVSNTHDPGF